ncbi:hypothetical protein LCGC14_0384170 [marine sediment metagenome]|uniref:Zinc-ribbon domain-containing protein n=1 Tax=marine sediment metagenome TaxID=412755 RepID=A0A0F9WA91_9ZZZZ
MGTGLTELADIRNMVTSFAVRMEQRMVEKMNTGKRGWNSHVPNFDLLIGRMMEAIDQGKWVDAANYAAILDYRSRHNLRDYPPTPGEQFFCPECGEELPHGNAVCENCTDQEGVDAEQTGSRED